MMDHAPRPRKACVSSGIADLAPPGFPASLFVFGQECSPPDSAPAPGPGPCTLCG